MEFIAVMAKLFLGAMQFITFKTLAQTKALNLDNVMKPFTRSFFVAWILFLSVMFSLIPYAYLKYTRKSEISSITMISARRISLSGVCDAIAQVCTIVGTSNVPVSLMMILKGSRALFSAGLSVIFFKRNLYIYQWVSLVLCLVGLSISSLGSFMSGSTPSKNLILGISLILVAEAFRSIRIVYDEHMMRAYKYNPFMIIGLEGVTGTIFATIALVAVNFMPGNDVGQVIENFDNTFFMTQHSTLVVILLVLLPLWVNSMYISGMYVTKLVSAVYNAIVTVLTVAVVWSYEIMIHYCVSTQYGDKWTKYSFMQLGGFVLILMSTLMYDATWKIPSLFAYPEPVSALSVAKQETDDESTVENLKVVA